MNTNNVFYAKIYRLIYIKTFGNNIYNYGRTYKAMFSRDTLVYKKSNGKFYDLLDKKYLNSNFAWSDEVGTEIVSIKHLVSFKEAINQVPQKLSKSKIKKLYIENKNYI